MKRILASVLAFLLVLSLVPLTFIPVSAAGENVVFLKGGGTGDGSSPDKPMGSLHSAAAKLAGKEGTIVVCGPFTQTADFNPKSDWTSITFTSVYNGVDYRLPENGGAVYQSAGYRFVLRGKTVFENLNLTFTGKYWLVLCQCNDFTVSESVRITPGPGMDGSSFGTSFSILTGFQSGTTKATELVNSLGSTPYKKDVKVTVQSGENITIAMGNRQFGKLKLSGKQSVELGGSAKVKVIVTSLHDNTTGMSHGDASVLVRDNAALTSLAAGDKTGYTVNSLLLRVEGGTVGAINLKKGTNVTYTNGTTLLDSGIVDDQYKTQFDTVKSILVFADGDKGDDTNDGSPEKPVKTLWKAFDLLKDTGGTVVIKGVVTLNASTQDDKNKLTLPEHQKPIAVTSLFAGVDYRTGGAKLVLNNKTYSLNLSGDVSFDNLVFDAFVNDCFIAARYHNLTIGANCTTVFSTGVAETKAPVLLAGVNKSDTAKKAGGETIKTPFSLQIAGGVWQSVRLGDRDLTEINTIDTTATLDISGGTFTGNTKTFYAEYNTNIGVMALYQCNLSQNAVVTMNITGGTFNGPVIGFGQQHLKKQNTQAGKIVMNITGGTFARSGDEYNSVVVPAGCMLSNRVTYDSSSSVEVNIDFPRLNLQTKPLTVLADKNENGPAITVNITGVYQGDPGIKVLDSENVTVNIPIIGEIEVTDVNRITAGTAVEESDFTYDAHGSAGAVSFRFYSDESCTDEIAAPSAAGTYWVKAYLEASGYYSAAESEPFAFEIFASDIQEDTTQRVSVSAGGGLRVSAAVEGNTISIGTIALNHLNGFGEGETLDLNLSRISKDVKTLKLSGGLLTNLSVSKLDGMTVTFPSGVVVNVDKATIKAVLAQSNGRAVQLRVRTGNVMWRTLNPAQRAKALGLSDSVDIFDASFLVGVTPISDFGGGTVTLNIPCDSRKQVRLWYLADNGAIEFVPSSYDKENGILTATLNHFSHYAIEEVAESDYKACEKGIYCPLNSYADLTAAEWYHDGIHYCLGKGLFQVSGNVFDPDSAATRARIVTALWRLEGMPGATAKSFPDVADGQYYTEAIRWASEKGIVLGYDNGNFGPDDSVTREQLAIILWRFAKYKNSDVSTAEKTDIAAYTDASLVNAQALSAMKWAVGSGLIQGTTLTTLEPQGIATNAQLATLVLRFAEAMGK